MNASPSCTVTICAGLGPVQSLAKVVSKPLNACRQNSTTPGKHHAEKVTDLLNVGALLSLSRGSKLPGLLVHLLSDAWAQSAAHSAAPHWPNQGQSHLRWALLQGKEWHEEGITFD